MNEPIFENEFLALFAEQKLEKHYDKLHYTLSSAKRTLIISLIILVVLIIPILFLVLFADTPKLLLGISIVLIICNVLLYFIIIANKENGDFIMMCRFLNSSILFSKLMCLELLCLTLVDGNGIDNDINTIKCVSQILLVVLTIIFIDTSPISYLSACIFFKIIYSFMIFEKTNNSYTVEAVSSVIILSSLICFSYVNQLKKKLFFYEKQLKTEVETNHEALSLLQILEFKVKNKNIQDGNTVFKEFFSQHAKVASNSDSEKTALFNEMNFSDLEKLFKEIKLAPYFMEGVLLKSILCGNLSLEEGHNLEEISLRDIITLVLESKKKFEKFKIVGVVTSKPSLITSLLYPFEGKSKFIILVRYLKTTGEVHFLMKDMTVYACIKDKKEEENLKTTSVLRFLDDFKNPILSAIQLTKILIAKLEMNANESLNKEDPSNFIKSYNQRIELRDRFKGDKVEIVKAIENIVDYLSYLTNDINLYFSADLLNSAELEKSQINIEESIKDIISVYDNMVRIKNKRIKLLYEINNDVPVNLKLDIFKLKQVLFNLVSNSFKFTQQGTIEIKVSLINSEEILIKVIDTGVGLTADVLEIINKPLNEKSSHLLLIGKYSGIKLVKLLVEKIGYGFKMQMKGNRKTEAQFAVHFDKCELAPRSKVSAKDLVKPKKSLKKLTIGSPCKRYFRRRSVTFFNGNSEINVKNTTLSKISNELKECLNIKCKDVEPKTPNQVLPRAGTVYNPFKFHEKDVDDSSEVISLDSNISEETVNTFNIILVDENEILRKRVKEQLEVIAVSRKVSLYFIECTDGAECLYEMFLSHKQGVPIHCLMVDKKMSFLDGYMLVEVISNLIKNSIIRQLPVFVFDTRQSMKNYNITGVLEKPMNENNLEKVIGELRRKGESQ